MSEMTHIRSKLEPLGGNSFYRNKRERNATTLCGAVVGLHDLSYADARFEKNIEWKREHVGMCDQCLALYSNPKRNWIYAHQGGRAQ